MRRRILSLLLAGVLLLSPVEQMMAAEPMGVVDIEAIQDGDTSVEDTVTVMQEDTEPAPVAEEEEATDAIPVTSGAMVTVDEEEEVIDEFALPGEDAMDMSAAKEEYFRENVNENYAKVTKMDPVNIIWVKQTLVDGSTFDGDSLTQLYATEESAMSLIAMYDDAMFIYNTDDENDYYIAQIDTMHNDMETQVTEVLFAKNNLNGEALSGCIYDADTGLAYIPKEYFKEDEYLGVQVQLLQKSMTVAPTTTIDIAVHNENIDESIMGETEIEADALDVETVIPIALDEEARETVEATDISVMLNGEKTDTAGYTYDPEAGEITIPTSPTNIESVEIHVEREPVYKRIWDEFTQPLKVEAATPLSQMQVIRSKSGKDCDGYKKFSMQIDGDPSDSVGVVMVSNRADAMYHSDALLKQILQNDEGDKGKNWERMYGIVGSGNSNEKLAEMAEMIGSKTNTSYKSLSEVENINTNDTVNFAFDMGTASWKDKTHGVTFNGVDAWLTCKCSHITNPNKSTWSGGDGHDGVKAKIVMRILKVQKVKNNDKISGYLICGFLTPTAYGQSGVGIYKIPYRNEVEEKPGKLRITKKSADPTVTEGNDAYSLKGAKFVVYEDHACTKIAKKYGGDSNATLVTGSDGVTGYVTLEPGVYYVKETKAPKGYDLPENPLKKITIKADQTTVKKYGLTFKDTPQEVPLTIMLKKIDATAETAVPSGGSTGVSGDEDDEVDTDDEGNPISSDTEYKDDSGKFVGTEYTIRLWRPVSTDSEDPDATILPSDTSDPMTQTYTYNNDGENETRHFKDYGLVSTWVFSVDPWDMIYLDDDHLVSGDLSGLSKVGGNYTLPLGYAISVKETKPVYGFKLDPKTYVKETNSIQGAWSFFNAPVSRETPYLAGLKVQKRDIETTEDEPQGDITFEGTKFELINESDHEVTVDNVIYSPGEVVYTMYANANGYAQTPSSQFLPIGDYCLKETVPATGNLATGITMRYFSIDEEDEDTYYDLTQVNTSILNNPIRGGFKLQKRDFETKDDSPMNAANFKNIKVEVTNRSRYKVLVNGNRYAPGEVCATFYTDAKGYIETDSRLLPYGTYQLTEIYPDENAKTYDRISDEGYKREGIYTRTFSIREDGVIVDMTDVNHAMINYVMRGDFELRKIDSVSQRKMDGISFRITAMSNGESHVFTTDENGEYRSASSWNPHSRNTNGGGSQDGLWFGFTKNGVQAPVDDTLPALPYDKYRIQEIASEKNAGKVLFDDVITIYKDKQVVFLNNIENLDKPTMESMAEGDLTDLPMSQFSKADAEAFITDTVSYDNLTRDYVDSIGQVRKYKYTLVGWLVDKETGKEVMNGNKRVEAKKEFYPKASVGEMKQSFVFDARELGGRTVVVFEELLANTADGNNTIVVATHEDLSDEDQTIYFPKIGTSALGKTTNEHIVNGIGDVEIIDTVDYHNLYAGLNYHMSGVLMDKKTGKAVTDKNGMIVTAVQDFHAFTKDGSVQVAFKFEAGEDLAGKTLVVYEDLMHGTLSYAEHKDINDEGQTVHVPRIETTASDINTHDHVGTIAEKIKVVDSVWYENLVVGNTYTIQGQLYDKATGKALLDPNGKAYMSSSTFVAKTTSGYEDLYFEVDASVLKGQTVVAYEDLFYKNIDLATHADINDEGQSVHYPDIGTSAKDAKTGTHFGTLGDEVTIIDTVTYKNLIPKQTYTVRGELFNKDTKTGLSEPAKAEVTFVPDTTDGSVELKFVLDTEDLEGKTLVAFEELIHKNVIITEHKDIEDEEQTIHIPKIRTKALDENSGNHVGSAFEESRFVDMVAYYNLIPGMTYRVSGILMDKNKEKPVKIAGKKVITDMEFIPETANGIIEMAFDVNGLDLSGKSVVVYEHIYYGDIQIAGHEDIDDEKQSLYYPWMKTLAHFDGKKLIEPEGTVDLTDVVTYKNLIKGKHYRVEGVLMDKSTGKILFDPDGKPYVAKKSFIPLHKNGKIEMKFTIDASQLENKEIVVFETMYSGDAPVLNHADINDGAQTVKIKDKPSPKTGDPIRALPIIIAMSIAGCGIGFGVMESRRKK